MIHPLTNLTSAEAVLIASIEAATERLNTVGTGTLQEALDRLQAAAQAASARLQAAGQAVERIASDVLTNALIEAQAIGTAIPDETPATTSKPAIPEPNPRPTFDEIQAGPLLPPMDGMPDETVDLGAPEPAAADELPWYQPGELVAPAIAANPAMKAMDETPSPFSQDARQHAAQLMRGHHVPEADATPHRATVAANGAMDRDDGKPDGKPRPGPGPRPKPRRNGIPR